MNYAVIDDSGMWAPIPSDVLDWLLVLGIDTIREGYAPELGDDSDRYLSALADLNAAVQESLEANR